MKTNQEIKEIIHNLKQISTINRIEIEKYPWISDFHRKSIEIFFQIQGNSEENNLFYEAREKEIDNLRKEKSDQELFELLIEKQLLEKRGQNPQDFQTPCPFCQQPTLNAVGWIDEKLMAKLKRIYCRLCRVSIPYLELTKDPIEVRKEMINYDIIIRKHEIQKDAKKLFSLQEQQNQIETRIRKNQEIINKYE